MNEEGWLKLPMLIFDFDGTLCDDFHLAAEILRRLLPARPASLEELRDKTTEDILRELKISHWRIPFLVARARKLLAREVDRLEPVAGMAETVRTLRQSGYRLGILSSNSHDNVRRFLKNHAMEVFSFLECGNSLFGKARRLRRILRRTGLSGEQALYVGDETRDVDAGRASGMRVVAASWGFNSRRALESCHPDGLIDEPRQLLHVLNIRGS